MFKKIFLLALVTISFASCYVDYTDHGHYVKHKHAHHSRERGRSHR